MRVQINCKGGKTRQACKDECDINKIIKRFVKTGELPEGNKKPIYGDFSSVIDFTKAYEVVELAKAEFNKLPVKVRERFNYNAQELLTFVNNPANSDELVKMGLAKAKPENKVETSKQPEVENEKK